MFKKQKEATLLQEREEIQPIPGQETILREHPISETPLFNELISTSGIKSADQMYPLFRAGIWSFLDRIINTDNEETPELSLNDMKVSASMIDSILDKIDEKMTVQMDAILHHPDFKKLESAWRSLKFLVDKTDFAQNIRIEVLDTSKEKLIQDFEDAPDVTETGLFHHIYKTKLGTYGGPPCSLIIGNYEFDKEYEDVKLLESISNVASIAHTPFIASVSPSFLGLENFEGLAEINDPKSLLEGPQYGAWQSLREYENARYIGLTLPRHILRLPYGSDTKRIKAFNYEEDYADHECYLWGNSAFALGSRIVESFARYRWGANIIGPQGGGAVEHLPVHYYEAMGEKHTKIPTEVSIWKGLGLALSEEGLIPLTMHMENDRAVFFSANSIQKPKCFDDKDAQLNFKLGTQLPYMFIINRLAHYIKALQIEHIGIWKDRVELEQELNNWIRQYVCEMDNPLPEVKCRKPLREAHVIVEDVPGEPGWYRVGIQVRPQFKYSGAFFTLSLVGRLDKK